MLASCDVDSRGFARLTVGWPANADAASRNAAVVGAVRGKGSLTSDQSIALGRDSDGGNDRSEES